MKAASGMVWVGWCSVWKTVAGREGRARCATLAAFFSLLLKAWWRAALRLPEVVDGVANGAGPFDGSEA